MQVEFHERFTNFYSSVIHDILELTTTDSNIEYSTVVKSLIYTYVGIIEIIDSSNFLSSKGDFELLELYTSKRPLDIALPNFKDRIRRNASSLKSQSKTLCNNRAYSYPYLPSKVERGKDLHPNNVHKIYPFKFLIRKEEEDVLLNEYTNKLTNIIVNNSRMCEYELHDKIIGFIYEKIKFNLSKGILVYRMFSEKCSKLNLELPLFVQSPGLYDTRILSSVYRSYGGEVISSIHGYNVGLQSAKNYGLREFDISSTILVPSYISSKLLEFIKVRAAISDSIFKLHEFNYKNIWLKMATNSNIPSKKKRVMCIGGLLGNQKFPFIVGRKFFHEQLEQSVGEAIKQTDHISIYKPRPGWNGTHSNYDYTELKSFEECMDDVDILIFVYVQTTTFNFSLLSNKPIIIFSHVLDSFHELSIPIIKSRCEIVPSNIKGNTVEIDCDSLVKVLEKKEFKSCSKNILDLFGVEV